MSWTVGTRRSRRPMLWWPVDNVVDEKVLLDPGIGVGGQGV
ncbi:hypothetical protein [Tessaracoccus sp.]